MRKIAFVAALVLVVAGFTSCGQEEKPQAEITFDESKCPIEVLSSSKSISPIPTFNITVKNVCPYDVSGFNANAVFFDENNKPLSKEPVSVPYDATLDPIKPDTTVELQTIGEEKAVSMKIVIINCIYHKTNPVDKVYDVVRYNWENKDFDKQIKALLETK